VKTISDIRNTLGEMEKWKNNKVQWREHKRGGAASTVAGHLKPGTED